MREVFAQFAPVAGAAKGRWCPRPKIVAEGPVQKSVTNTACSDEGNRRSLLN
jgi:hypothetical protein